MITHHDWGRPIINGLFGHFNHVVKFKDNNITIITAPNGYGKTVCLKVVDSIFNRKLVFLCDLQFSLIELHTSEGVLVVEKDIEERPNTILLGHSDVDERHKFQKEYEFSKLKKIGINSIDEMVPFLYRVGAREWADHRTDEVYSLEEVLESFSEYFPESFTSKKYPQWYIDFSDSLNAHFIQDQRLIQSREHVHPSRRTRKSFTNTIEKYADELAELIKQYGLKLTLPPILAP